MSRELVAFLLTAHSSMLAANFQFSVFHFQLFLGVPAKPSGFPLYLCSFRYRFTRKGCRSNP